MKSLGDFSLDIEGSKVVAISKAMIDLPRLGVRLSSGLTICATFWECRHEDLLYSSRGFGYQLTNKDIEIVDSALFLMLKFFMDKHIEKFIYSDDDISFSISAGDIVWSVYPKPLYEITDMRQHADVVRAYVFLKDGNTWKANSEKMTFG